MFRFFKKKGLTELEDELLLLCREWFDGQIGDLPEDELPPESEIEQDIIQMRDETLERIKEYISGTDAISNHVPNDAANSKAMKELSGKYSGHEATTPIFTKLALSKQLDDRYQGGWPLCTIRLIAETYLKQSTGNG